MARKDSPSPLSSLPEGEEVGDGRDRPLPTALSGSQFKPPLLPELDDWPLLPDATVFHPFLAQKLEHFWNDH
jgi:hypothetical protein